MIPTKKVVTGTTFATKVHPKARNSAITCRVGDVLKVFLKGPGRRRSRQHLHRGLRGVVEYPRPRAIPPSNLE
jgi:hypothetical protein